MLAIGQTVLNPRFGITRVRGITRAESGIAFTAQVHEPAPFAISQGAQCLSVGRLEPNLVER